MPILLLTTSDFRAKQSEVNAAIAEVAQLNSNVTVLDWGTISKNPGVLSGDKIHPSPEGNLVFVSAVSQAFGRAPKSPGSCLSTQFTDDSAVTSGIMPTTTAKSPSSSNVVSPTTTMSNSASSTAPVTTISGQ
jgi:hypothetical protein